MVVVDSNALEHSLPVEVYDIRQVRKKHQMKMQRNFTNKYNYYFVARCEHKYPQTTKICSCS